MGVTIARTGAHDDSAAVRGLIVCVNICMELIPADGRAKENRLA